ncbi:MAG: CotH kinase family protein [Paludibacteraceae bacterium]|nr:CotH kinase family protein [Paludibacteraceae bacterium]
MRFLLLPLLLCCFLQTAQAAVRFSEVMQANVDAVVDDENEMPAGWIELETDGSVADYTIALSGHPDEAFILPDCGGKRYPVVFCDEKNKGWHTSFKLPIEEGEVLYLFSPQHEVVDSLLLPEAKVPNASYARRLDADGWAFFRTPTPAQPNNGFSANAFMGKPKFSQEGGVKSTPFHLKISSPKDAPADAVCRYTTNGDVPTPKNRIFPDSLLIDTNMVVRAAMFSDSAIGHYAVSQTYVFLNRQQTMPLLALSLPDDYLYDPVLGIYTKGEYGKLHPDQPPAITVFSPANYFYEWFRPAYMEYYPEEGAESVIGQLTDLRIGGNASRSMHLKSFVVKARDRYGKKRFNYNFFPDKPALAKHKSLVIRTSGQDANGAYLRDAFAHVGVAKKLGIPYQAYQPVLLFVNGNYWGVRNLRERSNADYISYNFDTKDFDLIQGFYGLVKEGTVEQFDEFKALYSQDSTSFETLDRYMDVDNFRDYYIFNMLFANTDFPGNNVLIWKDRKPGAKWQWIAKDMDISMGLISSPYDLTYFNYTLRTPPFFDKGGFNEASSCRLFQKMMSLPHFRQSFIDHAVVDMGTFANANSLNAVIDSLSTNLEYEMPFFMDHIGFSQHHWETEVRNVKKWISKRIPFIYADMGRYFEMGDAVPLKVKADASCRLNNIKFGGDFDGAYYPHRRIRLSEDSLTMSSDQFHAAEVSSSTPVCHLSAKMLECWGENDVPQLPSLAAEGWLVTYVQEDSVHQLSFEGKALEWRIPVHATSVVIVRKNAEDVFEKNAAVEAMDASQFSFEAIDLSGRVLAKGNYSRVMGLLRPGRVYVLRMFEKGHLKQTWKVCRRR